MVIQEEILSILRGIYQAEGSLRLINVFKGLPISYDARILKLSSKVITLEAHPYQIVCLDRYGLTHIRAERLPRVARADVIWLDHAQRQVGLSNLRYVSLQIGNRSLIRVEPEEPLELYIWDANGKRFRGELIDISQSGMAISMISDLISPNAFHTGANLKIEFSLPATGPCQEASITGRCVIAYLKPDPILHKHRMGMQLFPDEKSRPIISRYISARQSEIQNEIRSLAAKSFTTHN
ncbi:MAG TPA: PilZ domain-containing protein [Chloroflexi bacterium]|nr:PilZ domain-containing protein [Chloroflexota bacterium]